MIRVAQLLVSKIRLLVRYHFFLQVSDFYLLVKLKKAGFA